MKKYRTMEDFLNLYKKPPHLWLESEEFKDVKDKTMEQVLSEIREEAERRFGAGSKPNGPLPKAGMRAEDLDSTGHETGAKAMKKYRTMEDFLNLYKKPPHLWLESEEFKDVKDKTMEQVLSEIREEAERRFGTGAKPDPSPRKWNPQGDKAKAA